MTPEQCRDFAQAERIQALPWILAMGVLWLVASWGWNRWRDRR